MPDDRHTSKYKIPANKPGQRTYAESLGARPATPEEKQQAVRQGILRNPNTRAYRLPDGTILSNRGMQQRANFVRYGESLTLEQRAQVLQQAGYRSGPGVKSNWIRAIQQQKGKEKEPWAKGKSYREIERDPRFQMIYEQWLYLRNKRGGDKDPYGTRRSGKWWSDKRFKFLKDYGVIHRQNGEWIS